MLEAGISPQRIFAKRFFKMTASVVAAYPCAECRINAGVKKNVQLAIESLHERVRNFTDESKVAVADALSAGLFRLHVEVNRGHPPTDHWGNETEKKVYERLVDTNDEESIIKLMRSRYH